ncbi:16687_t:CDS:1, partial [Entrophospora sp. SA101]
SVNGLKRSLTMDLEDDEDEDELRYLRKRRDKKKSTADLLEVYINHCISQQEERRKERELKEKERKERHERREKLDMMMFNILHNISMPFSKSLNIVNIMIQVAKII